MAKTEASKIPKVAVNICPRGDENHVVVRRKNSRSWMLVVLMTVLASCNSDGPTATVAPTTSLAATTTTNAELEMSLTGCSAPPVTFAVLCEVVELLDLYHVDPPGLLELAAAATAGVRSFSSIETEPLPRGITCAVPTSDFASFCEAVATRLETDHLRLAPMIESAVASMLADTVDPYTMYVPPELSGAVGEDGIIPGLSMVVGSLTVAGSPCVRIELACPLQVITVLGDGSAETSGLVAGDVIEQVDGEDVLGQTVIEVAGKLAGEPGTQVELLVDREGTRLEIDVVRADASAVPVSAEMVGTTGYVRLPEFGIDAHLFMHGVLESLIDGGARRLVLDLRDNPGGYLFSVSIIGSEFFSTGLLYRTAGPLESLEYPAVEGGIATSIPMITLVNGSSASASEILAAVLQERGRSVIVGLPTYGKNLVQLPFELHNGGYLRVTTARWTTPEGASVEGAGVVPDVVLDLPRDLGVAELVDAAIDAAG